MFGDEDPKILQKIKESVNEKKESIKDMTTDDKVVKKDFHL